MTASQQYSGSGDGIGGFEGAADAGFSTPAEYVNTEFGRQTLRRVAGATREE